MRFFFWDLVFLGVTDGAWNWQCTCVAANGRLSSPWGMVFEDLTAKPGVMVSKRNHPEGGLISGKRIIIIYPYIYTIH